MKKVTKLAALFMTAALVLSFTGCNQNVDSQSGNPEPVADTTVWTAQPEGSFQNGHKVLAIGQKAAWFEQTGFFVNIIESGGLWGYEGIRGFCRLMEEALSEEKDLRDIIPRKGLGWPSLCDVPGAGNVLRGGSVPGIGNVTNVSNRSEGCAE